MYLKILLSVTNSIDQEGLHKIIFDNIKNCIVVKFQKNNILNHLQQHKINVIIIEIKKSYSDFELVKKILKDNKKIKIYIFCKSSKNKQLFKFIYDHNLKFFIKSQSITELIQELRLIKRLETVNNVNDIKLVGASGKALSSKEIEIGLLLSQGYTIKQITAKNNTATSTVSTLKRRLFEKLKVKNNIDMAHVLHSLIKFTHENTT